MYAILCPSYSPIARPGLCHRVETTKSHIQQNGDNIIHVAGRFGSFCQALGLFDSIKTYPTSWSVSGYGHRVCAGARAWLAWGIR